MRSIREAKRDLARNLRDRDGFVGVGIGNDSVLRLYVRAESSSARQILRSRWNDTYEGYPVTVTISTGFSGYTTDSQ